MIRKDKGSKPICVVLDTNVWVHKTSLLRTALGAALTNSLVRLEGIVGLPEIIEEEIVKHTIKFGGEAAAQIRENLKRVEMLVGYVDDYSPPREDQFEAGAKERLRELEHLLKRVPYDFEQLRSALSRLMAETPPNATKNQQYKDSVIWEAVLKLSDTHTVHFVTEDKAFFEGKEPRKGLASSLREECEIEGRAIAVHHGLESCLESLREAVPPLDREALAVAVDRAIKDDLVRVASDQGFELHELIDSRISAFLTERAEMLAVSFELDHRAWIILDSGEEVEATLITKGNCSYNLRDQVPSGVRLDSLELLGPEGDRIRGKGVLYLHAGSVQVGGVRGRSPFSLRIEMDEENLDADR